MPLGKLGKQRQELEPLYAECGTVYIFKPEVIKKTKSLYGKRIYPLIINNVEETMDIDTKEDLKLVKYFLN